MENDQFQKKLEDIVKWSEAEARKQSEINKEMRTLNYFYSQAPSTVKSELVYENGYLVDTLHQIYLHKPQAMEASLSSANSSGLINVANHWTAAGRDAAEYKWSVAVIEDLSRNESISSELNSLKDVLFKLWPQLVEHVLKIKKYIEVSPFDAPAAFNSIRNLYIKVYESCFDTLAQKYILNEHDKKPMKILEAMLANCGIDKNNVKLINEYKIKLNNTFSKMSMDVKELVLKDEQETKISILKYLKDLAVFLKALDPSQLT
jgi:hypothetical protein